MNNKTKAVFLIPLLFLISCCDNPKDSAFCEKPKHWVYNEIEINDFEHFNEITVKESSYIIWGYKIQSDKEFVDNIKKELNSTKSKGYKPRYIFLRSNKNISCKKFNHVAQIIDTHYPCKNGDLCIWAHGLGDRVMPLGITSPPERPM